YKGFHQEELLVIQSKKESSQQIKDRLFASIQDELEKQHKPSPTIGQRKMRYIRYAAASLVLFLSLGIGFFYYSSNVTSQPIRYTKLLKGDVGPGGNNAILDIGNRATINLDQVAIGQIDYANGVFIRKDAEGIISIYYDKNISGISTEMTTIKTPAGGQYKVNLPDGTQVWLNSSSIIRFPNVFSQAFREVELVGEAFFDVSKVIDKDQHRTPFYINSKNQHIEVLGTRFNVHDYPGESAKTTLVEGSVRVYSLEDNTFFKVLKPGQQALLANGKIEVATVEIEPTMAWRNGDFIFTNESLRSIMKKIERWYDVEVEYEGDFAGENFSGAVSRSKNLSEVLKIMEYTGKVKFKIQGRRILVMK
ncbi:MAG: FecR family protein, partial [Sphingobacterium sp.]